MKKVSLIILCFVLTLLPCSAKGISLKDVEMNTAPHVFIYHIPDDEITSGGEDIDAEKVESKDIVSDDVTADTSGQSLEEEDIQEDSQENNQEDYVVDEYQLDDMYTDVLHGYAVYDEEEETITLDDSLDDYLEINIQKPLSIKGGKYYVGKNPAPQNYSKYSNMEYSIKPIFSRNYRTKNGFSAGTTFSQEIDFAELEQSTGVFSKYENKHFSITTAYTKTINSTNNNYNDNIYFTPELKINQYFSLREALSADIVKNRKKVELVLSINPFGNRDYDRLRLEFGANATFDDSNALLKNQIKFSTKLQL